MMRDRPFDLLLEWRSTVFYSKSTKNKIWKNKSTVCPCVLSISFSQFFSRSSRTKQHGTQHGIFPNEEHIDYILQSFERTIDDLAQFVLRLKKPTVGKTLPYASRNSAEQKSTTPFVRVKDVIKTIKHRSITQLNRQFGERLSWQEVSIISSLLLVKQAFPTFSER